MPKRSHRKILKAHNPKISIAGQKARELSWVAHHEAAHAVARLRRLPGTCYGASIVPSGSILGVALGEDPFSSGRFDELTGELVLDVDEVGANIVVLLAGYFGAVRAGCPAARARRSAEDDDELVVNLLEKISKTRTVFQQEATQLVEREWNAIAAARELLAHRSLDADEIEVIADPTLSEEARAQMLAAYRVGMRPQ
jgi:hypothetical protein